MMYRRISLLLAVVFILGSAAASAQEIAPFTDAAQDLAEPADASAVSDPAALAAPAPDAAVAAQPGIPNQALTPQILYQTLLAEIALQRGQFALASQAYLDLARTTRDARIAKRAAQIGLHSRHYDSAIDAARLWLELQPDEPSANQMLATLYLATQRTEELATTLARHLAQAGPTISAALMRLNGMLARNSDKAAVLALVGQITTPYLNLPEAHFVRAQAAANAGEAMRALAEIDQALELKPDWEIAALFKLRQLPASAAATDYAKDYLRAHPEAREVRLAYARLLVTNNRYSEARDEFRRLREHHPDNPDVRYALGVLALQLDDTADAKAELQKVVDLGKTRVDAARFYLGQIAENTDHPEEALRWYHAVREPEQRLPALSRGILLLARLKRVDEARSWLASARQETPADGARLFLIEAQLLRDHASSADALALVDAALLAHPDDIDLLYEAGLAADRANDLPLLERRFRQLITRYPDSPQGYNALGYSFADRGIRLDEALQLVDKALSLGPDDFYILDSKGWVLFRQGKLAEALTFLQRAYGLKPEPEIAAHIGEVLWNLGKRDEAATLWRAADKANPGNRELVATIKRFLP